MCGVHNCSPLPASSLPTIICHEDYNHHARFTTFDRARVSSWSFNLSSLYAFLFVLGDAHILSRVELYHNSLFLLKYKMEVIYVLGITNAITNQDFYFPIVDANLSSFKACFLKTDPEKSWKVLTENDLVRVLKVL